MHHQNYVLKETSYGGRGLFATEDIEPDTLVLSAPPYSSAVLSQFRKEVCLWCFQYRHGTRMPVKHVTGSGKSLFYFCGPRCLSEWEENIDIDSVFSQTVSRLDSQLKEQQSRRGKNVCQRGASVSASSDFDDIDELYFLLMALVIRWQEGTKALCSTTVQCRSWNDILRLQSSEGHLAAKGGSLFSTKIESALQHLRGSSPAILQPFIDEEAVRAIVGRDAGNAFGIWEQPLYSESEFLGWALYPDASFFNHDCQPNVNKSRNGRVMEFWTKEKILKGQELCISYGIFDEKPADRRQRLKDMWFFECSCMLCNSGQ